MDNNRRLRFHGLEATRFTSEMRETHCGALLMQPNFFFHRIILFNDVEMTGFMLSERREGTHPA
jgi:hypothetical protein